MTKKSIRVMVTGANGMLGRHLVSKLSGLGFNICPVYSRAYDLRYQAESALNWERPNVIYHLAANVGGLQHNLSDSANVFHDNVMMNTDLIFHAARNGVKKFVFAGSVCSYPSLHSYPSLAESWLGLGFPEASNRPYGMSKLLALVQLESCHQQYGMDFSYPVLANMYGPYDKGFADDSRSHVVPSLVKKFVNDKEVVVWGDGLQTRDLLYVEDAADALVRMADIECRQPVNIATGREVSVERICDILEGITNFRGGISFDTSKPSGQLRRCYNIERAKQVLNWEAVTSIEEGLKKTVEWYKKNR